MTVESNSPTKSAILIVTDQLPYPPRNGITLPVFNYALGLMQHHAVKFCLLTDVHSPINSNALMENESIFGKFDIVHLQRKDRLTRLLGEISGDEMYQHGWMRAEPTSIMEPHIYDTLIVSPMSAVAKWRSTGLHATKTVPITIAAVNDCTTAEYYFRGKQSVGGLRPFLKGLVDRLRSRRIAKIEAKLLDVYKYIFLQTPTDMDLMRRLVSEKTASKVITVPNGVRAEYYELKPAPQKNVVFVAELSGEYAAITEWLISDVWPNIAKHKPEYQLIIVGKGASTTLKKIISTTSQITHIEFVDDLGQLYSQAAIVLSPVFKGFGLINKTLEAMAASVPVIGGSAAFNGIEGFINGIHGIACKTHSTDEFVEVILQLIGNQALRESIGRAGHDIIKQQFQWEFALNKIETLICNEEV